MYANLSTDKTLYFCSSLWFKISIIRSKWSYRNWPAICPRFCWTRRWNCSPRAQIKLSTPGVEFVRPCSSFHSWQYLRIGRSPSTGAWRSWHRHIWERGLLCSRIRPSGDHLVLVRPKRKDQIMWTNRSKLSTLAMTQGKCNCCIKYRIN